MTTLDTHVPTCLGDLHVRRTGTGPPAVLWHSLWVDSRSWGPLADALATQRQVVTCLLYTSDAADDSWFV